MHWIAQEVGVDNELKAILVGDEHQVDLKPFQTFQTQYDQVEWGYKKLDQHHNPEPYIEIRLKQDVPLFQPCKTSQKPLVTDVKDSERYTAGDRPADLYQLGTYGSCLSSLRSRLAWSMQGNFISKDSSRLHMARVFNGGTHGPAVYPEFFAQSPLLIETFLHVQTWLTRHPRFHQEYALGICKRCWPCV